MNVEWTPAGEYSDIRYELSGDGIAKITINRPEVRNAFRPQTLFQLREAFNRAQDDPTVGVIICGSTPTYVGARSCRPGRARSLSK